MYLKIIDPKIIVRKNLLVVKNLGAMFIKMTFIWTNNFKSLLWLYTLLIKVSIFNQNQTK